MIEGRALVLGGGGVAGIAWLNGLFAGLAEEGVTLLDADLILATSAGSTAAAQLTSGAGMAALLAAQIDPAQQTDEPAPDPALRERNAEIRPWLLAAGDKAAIVRRRCDHALTVATISEAERRAVIAARLPVHAWPPHPLRIVAVDTATGEAILFDRDSGVGLVDAVAASCSVPGIWPPTTIGDRRYTDGGVRSPDNVDLACGHATILLLAPIGDAFEATPPRDLHAELAELERSGARVLLVQPDAAARAAMSENRLDPATRGPAAQAGLAQGRRQAAEIGAFWRVTS